ncbi:hypothetical protein E1162_15255 [Rhodobacteraceae bacterium RKSG542]|uniref:hypothetical protein n=1 Tax=Pseudovibrio flavus TaxID=2529854 RepID=UPI0012BC306F|nr:hypothetical protein [Pseudovibrio flavus]MTI18601.1 hypothetical protein [Pseudovibrio flavus]
MPSSLVHSCRKAGVIFLATSGLLASSAAFASELSPEFIKAHSTYATAWSAQDLSFTTAAFVTTPARSYGVYEPKATASFQQGEPLIVYAEPVGYDFAQKDGEYLIDLSVGFELRNMTGQILAAEESFAQIDHASRAMVREFQTSLRLDLQGIPEGDYLLKVSVKDNTGGDEGFFELPFNVLAPVATN